MFSSSSNDSSNDNSNRDSEPPTDPNPEHAIAAVGEPSKRALNPPLPYNDLCKGDYIYAETIEKIYGVRRTDSNYWTRQLGLKDLVEGARTDLKLRSSGDDLYIMTDPEAEEYTYKRAQLGARQILKSYRDRSRINQLMLNDTQRKVAEHRDEFLGMLVSSNRREAAKHAKIEQLLKGSVDDDKVAK